MATRINLEPALPWRHMMSPVGVVESRGMMIVEPAIRMDIRGVESEVRFSAVRSRRHHL
jgi:hypothetical protein